MPKSDATTTQSLGALLKQEQLIAEIMGAIQRLLKE